MSEGVDMNAPTETTPQDETRSASCARCGYAWYIHGSFDFDDLCDAFVAKEPRVAVVRPHDDAEPATYRLGYFHGWSDQKADRAYGHSAMHVADRDEPASVVVRPTRDQIQDWLLIHHNTMQVPTAERLADGLLRTFWPGVEQQKPIAGTEEEL